MEFKETEEAITLHGLGFLQVKLQANQRLHVWHPQLPKRKCSQYSSIHDHRFSFRSKVLIGTQININFEFKKLDLSELPGCTHISYLHEGERTKYGNRPWIADEVLKLTDAYKTEIKAGDSYSINAYEYHSTLPGGDGRVATLMTKTFQGDTGAHSICVRGITPDVDFDRKQWPEERMWAVVCEVLGANFATIK